MDFIHFKIRTIRKREFENTFHDFCKEQNVTCHQQEYQDHGNYVTGIIPKYAIDKLTEKQIDELNSFSD